MADNPDASFIKLAVARGLLSPELAKELYHHARDQQRPLDELLIERGVMTSYNLDLLHKEHAKSQGPRIIGGCEIKAKLGQGGMGAVYRAVQLSMGREVALKVLAPEVARKAGFAERFLREGKAMGAISHPNVITCFDAGPDGKVLYMALELMTGGDAEQAARRQGGRLPPVRACEIVRDGAAGLGAIAKAGLIHRDIKPANIFLGEDGIAKLADLGLARQEDGEDQMTLTGTAMGTPAYMSPEQAKGEELDIRSDIYALGATLFALVTGQPPFVGASAFAIVARVINEPVPDPRSLNPDLPEAVVTIIRKMMAKDRRKRLQTPAELVQELNACLDQLRRSGQGQTASNAGASAGGHSSPTPLTLTPKAGPHGRRTPRPSGSTTITIPRTWLIAGASLVVTLIASLGVFAASRNVPVTPTAGESPAAPVAAPEPVVVKQTTITPIQIPAPAPTPAPAAALAVVGLKIGDPWPDFAAWVTATQALPASQQIERVALALRQLNPRATSPLSPRFEPTGRRVPGLEMDGNDVTDVRPLQGLAGLRELALSGGSADQAIPLWDLGALEGLHLSSLRIRYAMVADLSPLAGMPLVDLDCTGCQIRDLRPVLSPDLRQLAFDLPSADAGIDELRKLTTIRRIGSDWPDLEMPNDFWAIYDQGGFPGSHAPATPPLTSQPQTSENPDQAPPAGPRPLRIPDVVGKRPLTVATMYNMILANRQMNLALRRRELGKATSEVVTREAALITAQDPSAEQRHASLNAVLKELDLGGNPRDPVFNQPLLPPAVVTALATWREACAPAETDFQTVLENRRQKALAELLPLAAEEGPGAAELVSQFETMAPISAPGPIHAWIDTLLANGDFSHLTGNRPTDWLGKMEGVSLPADASGHYLHLETFPGRESRMLRQTLTIDPQWQAVMLSARIRITRKSSAVPGATDAYGGVSLLFEDPTGKLPPLRHTLEWPTAPLLQTWLTLGGKDSQPVPPEYHQLSVECGFFNYLGALDIDDVRLKAEIIRP